MEKTSDEACVHVTLVHGTFAPGAGWTQHGSLLRNALEDAFSQRLCFHDDFRWSGLPSHLARHVAAKRLQAYLQKLTDMHPGSHYVIGHSHGALVTLYALRDPVLAQRIAGVVSLSTPYLIARRRQLSIFGMIAAILGLLGVLWLGITFARMPFARSLDSSNPGYITGALFMLGFVLQIGLGRVDEFDQDETGCERYE